MSINFSWTNYLKLGIVHYMSYPEVANGEGPIVETLSHLASDEFFEGIEITWIKDPAIRKRVSGILECAYMDISYSAGVPLMIRKLSLNDPNEATRLVAVDQVKSCIDEALVLGAKRVSLVSGPDPGDEERQKAKQHFIEAVQDICRYALRHGIYILLESFDRSVDRKALIGPSNEAAEVINQIRVRTPNIGIQYDLTHMPLLGETAQSALEALQGCLAHIHLGNCISSDPTHPYFGDRHLRFGVPGGETDVKELADFLCALFDVGYLSIEPQNVRPTLAFEVKPMSGEDPEIVIAGTKRVWTEAWSIAISASEGNIKSSMPRNYRN